MKTQTFFVSWQDPSRNLWYPVARFRKENGEFKFSYTKGASLAREEAGFLPFLGFDDIEETYHSDSLFPFFKNRIMNPSRPDYGTFLEWLGLDPNEQDPLVLLAETPAREEMDYIEVFPKPSPAPDGRLFLRFFTRGLRHFDKAIQKRILELTPGDPLSLMHDLQNPVDPGAFMARTTNGFIPVGYLPRHLCGVCNRLIADCPNDLSLAVERINDESAPIQFRVQCRLLAEWPAEGVFTDELYEPIQKELSQV